MQADETWFSRTYPELKDRQIAYFSMEFGLHETLPIYAGGLGVLSGDHAKEASDLGLPFAAVGFFYTEGYFTQRITEDGWQEAHYDVHPFQDLPVLPMVDERGAPLQISVQLPGREVFARIWEIQVGRVPVYLLDANVESNNSADRLLTARLYSSDLDLRISQEILLGIGGVKALRKLGYSPARVAHERGSFGAARPWSASGSWWSEALLSPMPPRAVRLSNVFTTHTPVPAGNDEFPLWLVDKYFSYLWPQLGLTRDQFIELASHKTELGGEFQHAGPGACASPKGETRSLNCTVMWPARCGISSGPTEPRIRCPSPTSPTASTPAPGWRAGCSTCSTATWAPAGWNGSTTPTSGSW